jgi:hypothetical protein
VRFGTLPSRARRRGSEGAIQIADLERSVFRWRSNIDCGELRVFVAGILSNMLRSTSVLVIADDRQTAADLVSLLDGWRHASTPNLRRGFLDLRGIQLACIPDLAPELQSAKRLARLERLALHAPIVAGVPWMTLYRRPPVRRLCPWLICRVLEPPAEDVRAIRSGYAPAARLALQRFLGEMLRRPGRLRALVAPDAVSVRLRGIGEIVAHASKEPQASAEIGEQLVTMVRTLALISGRREVSPLDVRLTIAAAVSRLPAALRKGLAYVTAEDRLAASWRPPRASGDYQLSELVAAGLLEREGRNGQRALYSATDRLRLFVL